MTAAHRARARARRAPGSTGCASGRSAPRAIPPACAGRCPSDGEDPAAVVEALAAAAEPGLVASAGPRYFGFVTGGALPAALAADWLTSAWDQNAGLHAMSPAAADGEATVLGWCRELLGLPARRRRRRW